MACASFDDTLTTMFEELEIELLGFVTKSQKDKPQLCVEGYYWIEDPKKKRGRQPKVPRPVEYREPMFSIDMWSVYSRILEMISRTNNFTESWHNIFSSMMGKHPLVYSLVDSFRKEQKMTEDTLIRLNVGIAYKRKPAYVLLDEQLIFAAKSYSKESFATYYDTINSIVS